MAKGNTISIKGKQLIANGIINTEDMTLEAEQFESPVSIKSLVEKVGLNGSYVKITIAEADTPITQSDLE